MNAKKFSDAMSEFYTKYVDAVSFNYKKKARNPVKLSGELCGLLLRNCCLRRRRILCGLS